MLNNITYFLDDFIKKNDLVFNNIKQGIMFQIASYLNFKITVPLNIKKTSKKTMKENGFILIEEVKENVQSLLNEGYSLLNFLGNHYEVMINVLKKNEIYKREKTLSDHIKLCNSEMKSAKRIFKVGYDELLCFAEKCLGDLNIKSDEDRFE